MKIIISLFFLIPSFAQDVLTFAEIDRIKGNQSKKQVRPKKQKKSSKLASELALTKKKLEAYRYIAKMQIKTPLIITSSVVNEAEIIGAEAIQAVMATSTRKLTIFSQIKGADLPKDTKITCNVYAKYKRICGDCNRIIINGVGHDIKAQLNNRDGSACVIGNVSDDKEKYLTGIFISEMAKGALALSQSSIPTTSGNLVKNTARNKLTQGVINTANTATDLMTNEFQTTEAIVTIPKGTNVVIQFTKRFEI